MFHDQNMAASNNAMFPVYYDQMKGAGQADYENSSNGYGNY